MTRKLAVRQLIDILSDLGKFGTPKVKLPDCPQCKMDELAVLHADLVVCLFCGWRLESKIEMGVADAHRLENR